MTAELHRRNTIDLYLGALHRRFGLILILAVAIYTMYKIYQSSITKQSDKTSAYENAGHFTALPTLDDLESHAQERTSLEDDQANSDESARSSDTLCRQSSVRDREYSFTDISNHEGGSILKSSKTSRNHLQRLKAVAQKSTAVLIFAAVYAQILLGIATYCGLFQAHEIFNGLAHWIKASVFFLFGIWVFTRYLGVLRNKGHAWNFAESSRSISAETIECSLIFTYGVSNLFLERLGHSQDPLSHMDIQHICIAAIFASGGLIGLLLESRILQRLLPPQDRHSMSHDEDNNRMYNVMPALVVFFTGLLMSQHHQDSQLSSNVHATWGYFFCAASVLRLCTYFMQYIRGISKETGRPPTEALAAFCLIAGSLVFMFSARDSVKVLDRYGIDLMFVVSVSVAGSLSVMVWTIYAVVLSCLDQRQNTCTE